MYYWRTTLAWDSAECRLADSMRMETLYLRLFDVVRDARSEMGIRPEATLRFTDSLATKRLGLSFRQIVPVVFLAPDVITRHDADKMPELASLLIRRIDQITEKNGLGKCAEVQIDFDWAQSNGKVYFDLLAMMAEVLHRDDRKLSTTIRLHQLALEAPPVDRGVLMCYNTGRIMDPGETNSILSLEAVEPYLRHLSGYSLPLSLALPDFGWNVVFRSGQFAFIAPGLQLADTAMFVQLDSTHFRARVYQSVPGAASATTRSDQRILPGDVIRREDSSQELNAKVLDAIARLRLDAVSEVVVYKN